MSLRADKRSLRAIFIATAVCTALAATAFLLETSSATAGSTAAHASKSKKSKKKTKKASIAKKLPTVKSIDPATVAIGDPLKIKGKNFTLGTKKMLVIFQRTGGRRFTAKGTATASNEMSVVVPDLSFDLVNGQQTKYNLRLVNRYGMQKKATSGDLSPIVIPRAGGDAAANDCDLDGVPNNVDTDDDNDLLLDSEEIYLGTGICDYDTDHDGMSDYYEYRVALEFNGGPILPYPLGTPRPDPRAGDSAVDYDGDGLPGLIEFQLWQYSKFRMDRFYSDADQDSDGDGITDDNEDEDGDLLTNYVEMETFIGEDSLPALSMFNSDTDGDGLCDGLDDLDHDGPPTPVAQADCTTPVPNNTVPGDPDPSMIDGDDNPYSNIGELLAGTDPYDACSPSLTSPYCDLH
jgi:hypothetical protein